MRSTRRFALIVSLMLVAHVFVSVPSFAQPEDAAALSARVMELYRAGKYSEAIPLAQRALAIREKTRGPNHPDIAMALAWLASLYHKQGRYADAEPLYKRSLVIGEKALGPDHRDIATLLTNLADLYRSQGRYADAEPLLKRSLAIDEKALGPNHADVALVLNNLAALYQSQGRYADAEPPYKRALAIREKALGPDHPDVAQSLNNLAALYLSRGGSSAPKGTANMPKGGSLPSPTAQIEPQQPRAEFLSPVDQIAERGPPVLEPKGMRAVSASSKANNGINGIETWTFRVANGK